jgi:DNA-binding transcriptional LysR family regulator
MLLDNLSLFLAIAEKRGLSAAGRELGLSPASVSERLARLEAHYGVTLFTRTTRAISLTDEGRQLVDGARRLLAEASELEGSLRAGVQKISGPIRLSAPEDLGRSRVVPIIDRFLADHPDVTIDLNLTDGFVDLVGQGIDFAVRYGMLADSTLRSKAVGTNRRVICASPDYLARRGTPRHPDELSQHDCIVMRFGINIDREWSFRIGAQPYRVMVKGRRIANDGGIVRQWCLEGHGICSKSLWDVHDDLSAGKLVEVLSDFSAGPTALQIVYPPARVQPRRVRLLMDTIASQLGSQPDGVS